MPPTRTRRLHAALIAPALVAVLLIGGIVPAAHASTEAPNEEPSTSAPTPVATADPGIEPAPAADPSPTPPAPPVEQTSTETAPPVAAVAAPASFIDVPPTHRFAREIDWMRESGISLGWDTPAGPAFRPNDGVNREAAAAFLFRLADTAAYTPPKTSPFVDVPTTHPRYREIAWMWTSGLSRGWKTPRGSEYRPAVSLTRSDIAVFLYRRAGNPDAPRPAEPSFRDVRPAHPLSREIEWFAAEGITSGSCTDRGREFLGESALTREQLAAFLYRVTNDVGVALSTCPRRFIDVPRSYLFAREIDWMREAGLAGGWDTDAGLEFRPTVALTRDAAAVFLFRAAGVTDYTAPETSPFVDVPKTHVFYREIAWMNDTGLSTGWAGPRGKEFRPNDTLQRDAMAVFLYRRAGSPAFTPPTSPFLDVGSGTPFAREIGWFAAKGITTGACTPRGREFLPYSRLTREQMAVFLYRVVTGTSAPLLACAAPNLTSPWSITVVANKKRPLSPLTWAPGDLVMPRGIPNYNGQPVRAEAARALESMQAAMRAEIGRGFSISSGYRSYWAQERLFNNAVARYGVAAAEADTARPGFSEHQTGLTVDLDDGSGCNIGACFGNTVVGQWLRHNGHRFGFILRYDYGQQHIVGYVYEPWHFRYVGTAVAQDMKDRGFVNLEDYFRLPAAPRY